jgi:UrcA family protein
MKSLALSRARDGGLIALLMTAAAAILAPALADAAPGSKAVTVNFSGIDTSTEAGVQSLYRRIRAAAEDACGPEFRNPRLARLRSVCVDQAIESAVAEANRAQLSALHQKLVARTGP